MLKSCKTLTPSNPASVSKKPRIHINFTKPNGYRPLGFLITSSLRLLLDPSYWVNPHFFLLFGLPQLSSFLSIFPLLLSKEPYSFLSHSSFGRIGAMKAVIRSIFIYFSRNSHHESSFTRGIFVFESVCPSSGLRCRKIFYLV